MNILILDNQTGGPLYGQAMLKHMVQKKTTQEVRVVNIPAEGWIAFLQAHYDYVPEVKAYLAAVESTNSINPGQGKFLEAVDESIEVSQEQVDWLLEFLKAHD